MFTIDLDLPKTDMALFGVMCPYCGKSDRIKPLESPAELVDSIDAAKLAIYSDLWALFNGSNGSALGVCKFCLNPLKLGSNGRAEPLV